MFFNQSTTLHLQHTPEPGEENPAGDITRLTGVDAVFQAYVRTSLSGIKLHDVTLNATPLLHTVTDICLYVSLELILLLFTEAPCVCCYHWLQHADDFGVVR